MNELKSHVFTAGTDFNASYPNEVCDANTIMELTYDGTEWLLDADTIVNSYFSEEQSYTVKANGLIKQFGKGKCGTIFTYLIQLNVVLSFNNSVINDSNYGYGGNSYKNLTLTNCIPEGIVGNGASGNAWVGKSSNNCTIYIIGY